MARLGIADGPMRTLAAQAAFARPASEPPLRAGERRRDIAACPLAGSLPVSEPGPQADSAEGCQWRGGHRREWGRLCRQLLAFGLAVDQRHGRPRGAV